VAEDIKSGQEIERASSGNAATLGATLAEIRAQELDPIAAIRQSVLLKHRFNQIDAQVAIKPGRDFLHPVKVAAANIELGRYPKFFDGAN